MKHAENNKNYQHFCFIHWDSMLGARGKLYKIYSTPNTEVVPYTGLIFDYVANYKLSGIL